MTIAENVREGEMLRYLDDAELAKADEEYWSEYHGSEPLFGQARARVYVDGRRVETPSGFRIDVGSPRGKKRRFPVEVDATGHEELGGFLDALEGERGDGREVTVEHEVDGAVAVYRVRGQSSDGFACDLGSGEPVVFERGKRVELGGAV